MEKILRTGIIGLGKMGVSHASIINAHPYLDLIAACDRSSLALAVMKKYTTIKCYSDFLKMIDENDLDCLFIATPTKLHANMAIYALERKIHLFCEKPIALTLEEGQKMVEIAENNKLVNQVGYHNRFVGTFNYFKTLLGEKVIGEFYHFLGEAYGPVVVKEKGGTWRSNSFEGGGCIPDYASHVINLIEYVFGDIDHVDGTLIKKVYSKEVEDAVYSSIHLKNGISGQISINWSDETYRKMSTQLTAIGSEGKIISDAQEFKIYLKKDNIKFGLQKGWNLKYVTDLHEKTDFYLRGEEYSAQIDYYAECVKNKKLHNRNSFKSAYQTDKAIYMLKNYKK